MEGQAIINAMIKDIDRMFGIPETDHPQGEPEREPLVLHVTCPPGWPKDPTGMTWREPLPMCHCEGE
jgi:hypothetical protein